MEIFLAYLFIALIAYLLIRSIVKRYKSSWTGIVIDKEFIKGEAGDDEDAGSPDVWNLKVETDPDQKQITVSTKKKIYESINVGDRVEKKSGEFQPRKVS